MKHEGRCIEFPCTCASILRENFRQLELRTLTIQELYDRDRKILGEENSSLKEELRAANKYLFEASQRLNATYEELKSCRKKIEDGLSCCCSGCTKHNQDLT
jgi:hypothetical protein